MDLMARVADGTVTQVCYMGDGLKDGFIACPPDVRPGWTYDGAAFHARTTQEPEETVEQWRLRATVDRATLARNALASTDVFADRQEALAFASGTIPQGVLDLISQLPVDMQDDAEFRLVANAEFRRRDPLWVEAESLPGWSAEQIDALFGGFT